LLFTVAAYNFANFMVKEFDLTPAEDGPLSMLTISSFVHFEEALQYYRMIFGKEGYASSLSKEIAIFPISDENYATLMRGKTLDEYASFLEESYGDEAAELIARLRARIDAALIDEPPLPAEPIEETPEETPEEIVEEPIEETIEAAKEEAEKAAVSTAVETITPPAVQQEQTVTPVEPPKSPAQVRKEKERAYKEQQKRLAKERKEKERAYKQKLKEREKQRRAALKGRDSLK
jgi:hypothetical protein